MINNKKTLVNKKIHEMRVKLWNEHFGLDKIECEDPLN